MATVSVGALKKVDLFQGLTDKELAEIAKVTQENSHQAGEIIVTLGKEADAVYIVRKGKVGVESKIPDVPHGRKEIIVATLTDGETCSWSALMKKKVTATIKAMEPTKSLEINANALLALCEQNPRIGYVMMKNLAQIISSRLTRHRLALLSAVTGVGEGW